MTTTTNVKQTKLNIMTKAQYNSATKSATELYIITDIDTLTTDDIVSSVSSASTNTKAVGAKLFYDTCGDIETLINAL